MKKFYETPDLEKCSLMTQENLMTNPSVSEGGFGYDDNGPVQNINPVS